jgi:glucose/arabinose dehydrogenase
MANPWSLAFLPDGSILVTEKEGRLRIIRNGVLDPKPVPGAPAVRVQGRSGLMDVSLHPQFATNHFVYFTYLKRVDEKQAALTLARGRFDGSVITSSRTSSVAARRERPVAARVGTRRQALHDDAEQRQRQQLSGSEQLRRQGASSQ